MIRTIFKHMWNQRSQNVWIFFELLFVGIFLWVVLDPLCVQLANKNIENGYEQDRMMSEIFGELNYTRKNTIFAIFGLLCVFLGMTGTFWVRANARRQEIGVMRSLGASKWRIISQFLTEAGILITITSIISTILIANYIYTEGFFSDGAGMTGNLEPNPMYWQNNPVLHFAIISLVVYLVLLVTALIATYIPVSRATCELPADALREE